jgi:hypothetical protein
LLNATAAAARVIGGDTDSQPVTALAQVAEVLAQNKPLIKVQTSRSTVAGVAYRISQSGHVRGSSSSSLLMAGRCRPGRHTRTGERTLTRFATRICLLEYVSVENDAHYFTRRSRWRELVYAKAIALEYELDRLAARAADLDVSDGVAEFVVEPVRRSVMKHLAVARSAAAPRHRGVGPIWRLVAGGEGAATDAAFTNLHAAKVALVDLYGCEDIEAAAPGVLARLRSSKSPDDDRLKSVESIFGIAPEATAPVRHRSGPPPVVARRPEAGRERRARVRGRRDALREAMQVSYEAADELHSQARGFRNVLIIATGVLTLLIVAVCLFGTLRPSAIPLCFEPSPGKVACPSSSAATGPSSFDVVIVALMGFLGGALSVTFTIQRLRGTSAPYDIPLALTINKLPNGALTSIIGLVLIKGDFIPGLSNLDNQGQILAYAILLGFAQHLATRFIDQKAEEVINSVPKKSSQPARQSDDATPG